MRAFVADTCGRISWRPQYSWAPKPRLLMAHEVSSACDTRLQRIVRTFGQRGILAVIVTIVLLTALTYFGRMSAEYDMISATLGETKNPASSE
jgi:hypothetical protein